MATLTGKHFTVKPKLTVLAAGAIETARLMLASNDVIKPGVGNQNDMVGRYFADHPVPRDVATLVSFNGPIAACYGSNVTLNNGAVMRVALSPTAAFCKSHNVVGSLTTIEEAADLDETGKAAVITTAIALGVDASNCQGLFGGLRHGAGARSRPAPDVDRRKDALGMPRLKLDMRISRPGFRPLSPHAGRVGAAVAGRPRPACCGSATAIARNGCRRWTGAIITWAPPG